MGKLSQGAVMPFFCARRQDGWYDRRAGLREARLTALLQPLVEELGYEFVGVDYSSNPKNRVLVLYIDKAAGIEVEDCEKTSREVSALMDVEDPIPGHYVLEVSSPGLDRPLFTPDHFAQFTGEEAKVSLFAPVEGRRKFKGRILAVEGNTVNIDQDGTEVSLDHGNIAKARLVPDYDRILAEHG